VEDATLNYYIRTNIRLDKIWTAGIEWYQDSLSVADFIRVEQLKIGDRTFRPEDDEDDFVEKDADNIKIYPYTKIKYFLGCIWIFFKLQEYQDTLVISYIIYFK